MLYPIGIQNFEEIRDRGCVYVDKTSQIYNLVTTGKYYFLSRPRRFGKSLLVSTMEAYFSGRKDLFTGLSIEKLEQDWISYPVLHIDLSGVSYDTEEILQNVLNEKLSEFEVRYGSEKTSEVIGLRFQRVIEAAYRRLVRSARSGQPEAFMQTLSSLFANTSYQIQGDAEKDFQYAMYIIMELLGEYVQVERTTSNGRIDLLLQTKDYIYIFELKVNADASEALRQIEDKGYARPFASDSRRLFKVGVSFSTATRRIEDWKIC